MNQFNIGEIKIGQGCKPFIIAEMSGNHNQSLERALKIVDAAADVGANAIKLQTYTADTITVKGALTITDEGSLWYGKELYDLYKEAYTPWEWHEPIMKRAREKGILCFSSPFDETSVDFLESLGVPAYKIASLENTDHTLLKKIAKTGRPVIMSTGVTNLSDIDESVRLLREHGAKEIALLKCTSTYPTTPENTNLSTIPYLRDLFNCQVGLSDHTMGIGVAIAAIALGASVVEKHFTLRRADGGVDSAFSMEPEEMRSLVIEAERAFLAVGKIQIGLAESEKESLKYKRSLYIVSDLNEGDLLTTENVKSKRPGSGLHTRYYDQVIGKKAGRNLKSGTPLSWNDLV